MSFDLTDAYLALAKLEENQQLLLAQLAFLIDKKVVPTVDKLQEWAIQKQKEEEGKDGKKTS